MRTIALLALCHLAALTGAQAQQQPAVEATPQRPTFTNDTSTTAPGTVEFEFGALGPASTFTLPTEVKFTPPAERGLFHEMEFSAGFDTVERAVREERAAYRFSNKLNLVARRPIWRGERLSFALAPRAEVFLRGDSGARLGGKAIAVYAFGLNGLVLNLTGTAATDPSPSNPDWQMDLTFGYGRTLGRSGLASRLVLAFEAQNEFPSGSDAALSLLQSLSYRLRPDLVLDVGLEQQGLRIGEFAVVFRGGLTYNVGRLWRH